MNNNKILLIDGMSYIYRFFHGLPLLTNSDGRPTNAVVGFARMLVDASREYDFLAVAMDGPEKTFRHREYEAYKAHREAMPEELAVQIPAIRKFIEAYGVMLIEKKGYEADDVIATLAGMSERDGMEVLISSGDKDMLSLVSDRIKVRGLHDKSRLYDAETVRERYGVAPERMVDLLSLMGDKSDNIPGVPGIGGKWAVKLVKEYGDLESVLAHASEVKNRRVSESLLVNADAARLSKKLVELRADLDLGIKPEDCRRKDPDFKILVPLLSELELRTILGKIISAAGTGDELVKYELVDDRKKFEALIRRLGEQTSFVIDVESTSVNAMEAEIVGISLSWKEKEACYIPFNSRLKKEEIINVLKPVLESQVVGKIGQNIKYDLLVLGRIGINIRGIVFDTMVASHLLNPGKKVHGLDALSIDRLGHKMIPITSLIGKEERTLVDVPVEDVCRYSCEDADITLRLKCILKGELEEKGLKELFESLELPLIEVLAEMERNGVKIDCSRLLRMSEKLGGELGKLEAEIIKQAGRPFNVKSPKQLGVILFDVLELPVQKKTKTGYSTDIEVLTKLAAMHPLPGKVLEYRRLAKLKSTYLDTLPALVNPETGKVHASFNQTGTSTGRLSSSNPNLQNIPVRTELGRKIREAFIPASDDYLFLSADYSQIDLRLLAHLSGDADLISAFERDEDIHRFTAGVVFGVDEEDVTPEMRRRAKTINFGIIYGMSAYGLAKELSIGVAEAQSFIDNYFRKYSGVREYIDRILSEARELGYVRTILGRRRYLPEINSISRQAREQSERIAFNTPVQGSAADIINLAMVSIHGKVPEARLVINLHDELIFEVLRDMIEDVEPAIKNIMEGGYKLAVPLKVKISVGRNWGEL